MPIKRLHNTPDYDAILGGRADAENATELTVHLRVAFIAEDPVDGGDSAAPSCQRSSRGQKMEIGGDWVRDIHGRVFRIEPWERRSFEAFTQQFKQDVEAIWNERIFVRFPDPRDRRNALPRLDYVAFQNPGVGGTKEPFLRCRLRVEPVRPSDRHHAEIHVLNIAPGQCDFQSFVAQRPGRSDVGFLSSRIGARTSAHEAGHMLGLEHVNDKASVCGKNSHADVCYGVRGTHQRRDVMGEGTSVHGGHGRRWLEAIAGMTGHHRGWWASHLEPQIEHLLAVATR